MFKETIAEALHKVIEVQLSTEEIMKIIEVPANEEFGDLSFPTFTLGKLFKKSPNQIAVDIAKKYKSDLVERVEAVNGFVNFYINKQEGSKLIIDYLQSRNYGTTTHLNNKRLVIDFSSPNIAKPFSMGHLRATVLGDSLYRILRKNGAEVIGINHLGDWGTQFGKLIIAYKKWGNQKAVEAEPIKELFELYQKFHVEAEDDQSLDDEARAAFSSLEQGNLKYTELWKWFKDVSLEAFQGLYNRLNISFDYIQGESYYNDRLEDITHLLEENNLIVLDEGAYIVKLKDVPPALIKKKDGSSLYITRDLAAMMYRIEQFDPAEILYVVGHEQSIHFEQLSQLSTLLNTSTVIKHIPFGLILKDGKKMSTRKGEIVLLEDIIEKVRKMAMSTIAEKNPDLEDKEKIADKIAISAIKFYDLKNDRMNSYEFSIEDMLKFDGETATYVMYTNARIQSILRKNKVNHERFIFEDNMWLILKHLSNYEKFLIEAADKRSPSVICRYILKLCRLFNSYYAQERVIHGNNENSKLILLSFISANIDDAMALLGIETVDEM